MYTVKMHTIIQVLITLGIGAYLILSGNQILEEGIDKELIPIIIVLYISFVLFAWYFLRVKVKVYIDEFVYYPMFGRKRTYKWNEVGMTELVHIKSGYSIKLYDRNDKKIFSKSCVD